MVLWGSEAVTLLQCLSEEGGREENTVYTSREQQKDLLPGSLTVDLHFLLGTKLQKFTWSQCIFSTHLWQNKNWACSTPSQKTAQYGLLIDNPLFVLQMLRVLRFMLPRLLLKILFVDVNPHTHYFFELKTACGWLEKKVCWCKRGDRLCDHGRTAIRTGSSKASPDWVNCFFSTAWEQEPWIMMALKERNSQNEVGEGRDRCRGWTSNCVWWSAVWLMVFVEDGSVQLHCATWPEGFYPLLQSLPGQLAAHGHFFPLPFPPSDRGAAQAPGRGDVIHHKRYYR